MKKLVAIILFFIAVNSSYSQIDTISDISNTVYLELGGSGIVYSFNYDFMVLRTTWHNIGVRAGVSFLNNSLIDPVSLNYIIGNFRHFGEIGIGATLINGNLKHINYTGCLMYRYQSDSGFLIRAGFTPLYLSNETGTYDFTPWFGLGLGVRLQ